MQTTQQALEQLKGTRLTLCSNCNAQVRVAGFTDREREADLIEIGLECPNCAHWYHAYFLNADLRDNRPGQNASREARRDYQKRFQRFQKDTRRRVGMKKVNGKWLS